MDIMEYEQQRKRVQKYEFLLSELKKVNLAIEDLETDRTLEFAAKKTFTFELCIGLGRTHFQKFTGEDLEFARPQIINALKHRAKLIEQDIGGI